MTSIAPHHPSGQLGFSPGKIALIAGLALILVGTIVYQFGGSDSGPATYTKRSQQSTEGGGAANSPTTGNLAPATIRAVGGKWPEISVLEASQFDPFAFPDALSASRSQSANAGALLQPLQVGSAGHSANANSSASPGAKSHPSAGDPHAESRPQEMKRRLEEQQAVAAELQRRGVGMIFRTSQGSVARLGDLEVRVGDVLNGLRVTEISADGIRLVPDVEDQESKTE